MPRISNFEAILPNPQPYVEKALTLYEKALRQKHGRIVFIAAELGGGKTEILSALAKALHREKPAPNFIAGFFRSGEYSRCTLDWQEHVHLKKAIAPASGIASLLSLYPTPYTFAASFIGQLLEIVSGAREFAEEFEKNPPPRKESAGWLKNLLRRAAEEKPLVCLLDDWDEAQRFYWDSMLLSLAREIAQELPLLLFITVKEPINLSAPEKDKSGLTAVIKNLTAKGLAELWSLKKLSPDEVAAVIGQAAPGIAAKLHGVTGGNARWVRELWREWRLGEIVLMDKADRWVWGEHHKATLNLYKDILEDRLARLLNAQTAMELEEAREVLACAALEGERFTADAVAQAIDWDRDELIDFLDEILVQTEDNPDGLLLEDGSINISTPDGAQRTLWLYRFASDLHWKALERYGFANEQRPEREDSERLEKSAALIEALTQTYAPEARLVAAQLARLLGDIGRTETARAYQQMANYAAEREVMREQALYLLAINKDDWEQWQCERAASFLLAAGKAMFNAFPHEETLAVTKEAYGLAHRAKRYDDEAHAHYVCSYVLYAAGEYKLARERANESLDIFRRLGKKEGMSAVLHILAQIDYAEGANQQARERLLESLEITREINDRYEAAASLNLLAKIEYDENNLAEAREQARQAMTNYQEIGNRHGIAVSLHLLAQIDGAEGNHAEARERATEALEIAQELGDRHDTSAALHLLSKVDYAEGNYINARERSLQALEIEEEIGDRHGAAVSLLSLSYLASEFDQTDEAFLLKSFCILFLKQIGHCEGEIWERDLSEWAAQQKYSEEEFQELSLQALEAYQKDGGKELIEEVLARLREVSG